MLILLNPLFDLFVNFKSVKLICNKLDAKYDSDDIEGEKYIVGKWLKFQITNEKSIME